MGKGKLYIPIRDLPPIKNQVLNRNVMKVIKLNPAFGYYNLTG